MTPPTSITTVAAALAVPRRLRLLALLGDGPLTIGRIAEAIGVVPSVASYHVDRLESAGLVSVRRPGRITVVRRSEVRWRRIVAALTE